MDYILDPAVGTGSFLCVEVKGSAVKNGVYTTPPEVLDAVEKSRVSEYAAALQNPPFNEPNAAPHLRGGAPAEPRKSGGA